MFSILAEIFVIFDAFDFEKAWESFYCGIMHLTFCTFSLCRISKNSTSEQLSRPGIKTFFGI